MFLCSRCRERLSHTDSSVSDKAVCDLCGNILDHVDDFFAMFSEEAKKYDFSTFLIGLRTPKDNLRVEKELAGANGSIVKSYKDEFQIALGSRIERELPYRADFSKPDVVFTINQENMDYSLWVRPIYLAGRYLKKRRGIPQSPWIKPGIGKEFEKSISEYIGLTVSNAFAGTDYNFFASGREDVDALMLGNGRPFYVEVKNPHKRSINLVSLSEEVLNVSKGGVEIVDLSLANSAEIESMKKVRSDKTYEVGLTIDGREISGLDNILKRYTECKINQRTPRRVLSIRKDKLRQRTIRSIEVKQYHGGNLILVIRAEAGTYIKEFITGDNGRTVPNLRDELDINVKIDYLNVLEVK
ncbi:MAG: tRNA pseudouridine(54/55) synthase Pus10 [Thermoplasmatales archaeon]